MKNLIIYLGLFSFFSSLSVSFFGHDSRPLFLYFKELSTQEGKLLITIPPSIPDFNIPQITLSHGCQIVKLEDKSNNISKDITDYFVIQKYQCHTSLKGSEITIKYPLFNPSLQTLIKIDWINGETNSIVKKAEETQYRIPETMTFIQTFQSYLLMGIHHIFGGSDHLLFILLLLIIANSLPKILFTITGFTLAHSITLILSTLDILTVNIEFMEFLIATSIVFLSIEILKNDKNTLAYKKPVFISSAFGLIHGFGFSAVLKEIDLPQDQMLTALLTFNLGVEVGQLIFIAILIFLKIIIVHLLKKYFNSSFLLQRLTPLIVYIIGFISVFWMIERLI